MARRAITVLADISSPVLTVAGEALTGALCNSFFPESNTKIDRLYLKPVAPTTGAVQTEVFIDGVTNYRFGLPDACTITIKGSAAYNCSVATSNTSFDFIVGATLVNGVATVLASPIVTKIPSASAAVIAFAPLTVNAARNIYALQFLVTGVAGDANGQWELNISSISCSTDLG
jgi:hypothetical protein